MRPQTICLLFACLLLAAATGAQELMSVDIQNRCVFSGGVMEEELYRFEQNNRVSEWVQEILDLGGAERNFELVQTNVENVSAVLDGNRRYLLFSVDFIQRATRMQVYASLAHEIGHHANEHTLQNAHRTVEESEADFFTGYVLSKKNFSTVDITQLLRDMPSSYGISAERRMASILDGYQKADQSLMLKSLQLENDPKLENLLLPTFQFMDCYSTAPIDRSRFAGISTLGMVNDNICRALDGRGYRNRSYFSVKNGFALVTQWSSTTATMPPRAASPRVGCPIPRAKTLRV